MGHLIEVDVSTVEETIWVTVWRFLLTQVSTFLLRVTMQLVDHVVGGVLGAVRLLLNE